MNLPVVLRNEAQVEFDRAFDWYEEKRAGLGTDFVNCVQETFDRITRSPETHGRVLRDVRRAPVRRFPYSIYYKIEADQVLILAVFHGKRDPRIWQARV